MDTYKTKEIAALTGVHPNTVRFYEDVGFITPPKRLPNGYRVFTKLHLRQMELVRVALRAEVLQNGLRKKAVEVIRFCAALDFEHAAGSAREYEAMLEREAENAKAAVASVESMLNSSAGTDTSLNRKKAAEKLNITVDTLRNWELNGLITVRRTQNGYRVYNSTDLERLNIIRTLRCANYSLSAILRLLNRLDAGLIAPVEEILNTPEEGEDIVSVCDRLAVSLENTQKDTERMIAILNEMKARYSTIQ